MDDGWIKDLHGYMGGTIKGLDALPLKIGGVADHVHLLVGCKTKHSPADLVREVKKAATFWVHNEIGLTAFRWQDGYAIFSVSPSACPRVATYIGNQAEHHRTKTSQEELEELLAKAKIEYDPKYPE